MSRPSTAESAQSARLRTSTVLPRAMSPTLSARSRTPLASVSSAHRDLVGGGEWCRSTPSYTGRLDTFGQIGAPGQDLRRLAVGPTLYLNGLPDKGPRATIATTTAQRRYGAFGTDAGPGGSLLEKRSDCKRSAVGPDPYDTMLARRNDIWHKPQRTIAFRADDGQVRSCEWSNVAYPGTIKHADTRRPAWIVRSQSRQVIVPHNRVQPSSRLRARTTASVWTPETQRPWPAVLPT